MNGRYILNAKGEPIECEDLHVWAQWMAAADRHVAETIVVPGVRVSTVFLGLDHSFTGPMPVLWETMIFGGPRDGYQRRFTTLSFAKSGHERACAIARAAHAHGPS